MSASILEQVHEINKAEQGNVALLASFRNDVEASITVIKNDVLSSASVFLISEADEPDCALIEEAMENVTAKLKSLYMDDQRVSAMALVSTICKLVEPNSVSPKL
jgi:hypothetical protein